MNIKQLITAVAASLVVSVVWLASNTHAQSVPTESAANRLQADIRTYEEALQQYEDMRTDLEAALHAGEVQFAQLSEQYERDLQVQDELGASGEAFPEIVKLLQTQKVQLAIDVAGLQARREFLAAATRQQERKVDSSLLQPFEMVLDLEKQALDVAQQQVAEGVAPQVAVRDAERRVLMAQIRLEEARVTDSSDPVIENSLFETAMLQAEKEARLDHIKKTLDKLLQSRVQYQKSQQAADQLESKRVSLEQYRNRIAVQNRRIQEMTDALNQLRQQLSELMQKDDQ